MEDEHRECHEAADVAEAHEKDVEAEDEADVKKELEAKVDASVKDEDV